MKRIYACVLALIAAAASGQTPVIGGLGAKISPPTPTTLGGVNSIDCAATFGAGYGLQKTNTDGTFSCAQFSGGSAPALTAVAGALSSPVTIAVAGTYVNGPSVVLSAGSWQMSGTVTILTPGGSRTEYCKLWDGASSVLASGQASGGAATTLAIALSGSVILGGSATYKISCTDSAASSIIEAAMTANGAGNNASTLVAVAVAGGGGSNPVAAGTTGQVGCYTANGATISGCSALNQNNMPSAYNNAGAALSPNATLQSIFDPSLPYINSQATNRDMWVPTTATSVYDELTNVQALWSGTACGTNCTDSLAYPGNTRLEFSFDSTAIGFATGGLLTRVVVMPTSIATAGAKVQAWVIRPSSFPTSTGTQTYNFTVVAQVGEIDNTDNNTYWEFSGLSIPVNAGDMIAFRVFNRGLTFGSGSLAFTNFREVSATSATIASLSDTTINGLTVGQSVSITLASAARQYGYTADVLPGPSYASANLKSTLIRLDSSGNIPDRLGRSSDMPWQGKKIIWVGTSIPANNTGGATYPAIVGTALQANMDNEAVGSSGMVWNGTNSRCLTLMATTAQLTSVCGGAFAAQSFQTKVLGKTADMLVIDHGHNDATLPQGTIGDNSPATAYSASGGTLTITGANNFTAGLTVLVIAASTDPLFPINGQTFSVLAGGLSGSSFGITTGTVAGSGTTTAVFANTATFYGAEQALIIAGYGDNPAMRIVLVTPPLIQDSGTNTATVRAEIQAIALKYQLPVVDLPTLDGLSALTNYALGAYCTSDGIHPTTLACRQLIARILYQALKGL